MDLKFLTTRLIGRFLEKLSVFPSPCSFVSISTFLSISLSLSLSLSITLFLSLPPSISLSTSVYLSQTFSIYLSTSLSFSTSLFLSLSLPPSIATSFCNLIYITAPYNCTVWLTFIGAFVSTMPHLTLLLKHSRQLEDSYYIISFLLDPGTSKLLFVYFVSASLNMSGNFGQL